MFFKKWCSWKFRNIHKKIPVLESLFLINFIKTESNTGVFLRIPFFTEHPRWLLLLFQCFPLFYSIFSIEINRNIDEKWVYFSSELLGYWFTSLHIHKKKRLITERIIRDYYLESCQTSIMRLFDINTNARQGPENPSAIVKTENSS